LKIMEWLKIIYALVGAQFPMTSLVVITMLGAFLFGSGWWVIGKQYDKEQDVKRQQAIAMNTNNTEVGTVAPANQTGVVAGIINGNVTVNTTIPSQPHKAEARDMDAIYQAGILVGKVYGARRSPTDATVFEFVEITHASQLNTADVIQYQNYSLRILTLDTKIGMMSSRPEDGTIFQKITAKIITPPIGKRSALDSGMNSAHSNEPSMKWQEISISTFVTHTCSHCGYGYRVNNFLGNSAAYIGATITCPKCENVEKVNATIFGL